MHHVGHTQILRRQFRCQIGIGKQLSEAAEGCANVEYCGEGENARPTGNDVEVGALRVNVSRGGITGNTGLITIFLTVLKSEHCIDAIFFVDDAIPTANGLIVEIFAGAAGGHKVLRSANGIGRWIVGENFYADWTNATLW